MKSARAEGLGQKPARCQHQAARYTVSTLRASDARDSAKRGTVHGQVKERQGDGAPACCALAA